MQITFFYDWIGAEGSCSDPGIFNLSNLLTGLETNRCNLPPHEILPHDTVRTPYFIVSVVSFVLKKRQREPVQAERQIWAHMKSVIHVYHLKQLNHPWEIKSAHILSLSYFVMFKITILFQKLFWSGLALINTAGHKLINHFKFSAKLITLKIIVMINYKFWSIIRSILVSMYLCFI